LLSVTGFNKAIATIKNDISGMAKREEMQNICPFHFIYCNGKVLNKKSI
jgi:hypothetical protein